MMKLCNSEILTVLEEKLSEVRRVTNESLDRRTHGPVIPNEVLTLNLQKFRSPDRLIELAVASWFLGDFGFFLRLEIQDRIRYYPERAVELTLCCSSCVSMLEYLVMTNTERSFFGNLVPNLVSTAQEVRIKTLKPKRPKKKVHRRGYSDHGALRPADKWLPKYDESLTKKQLELEAQRQSEEDTILFLRGFLGEL